MARRLLGVYFAVTAGLWLIVSLSERCWTWQNEHQIPDIGRRDACLATWWPSSVALLIFQLTCLGIVTFVSRSKLGPWPRSIVAICALAVLMTNTLVWVFLFMPRIH